MENSTAPSFPLQCQYKRFYDMSSVVKQFFCSVASIASIPCWHTISNLTGRFKVHSENQFP